MKKQWAALLLVVGLIGVAYAATAVTTRAELVADEPQGGGGGGICYWERVNTVWKFSDNLPNVQTNRLLPISGTFYVPLNRPYSDVRVISAYLETSCSGGALCEMLINDVVCQEIVRNTEYKDLKLAQTCLNNIVPGRNNMTIRWVPNTDGFAIRVLGNLTMELDIFPANC